jgi:hypothetical protein
MDKGNLKLLKTTDSLNLKPLKGMDKVKAIRFHNQHLVIHQCLNRTMDITHQV